jgi:hypothetical protein
MSSRFHVLNSDTPPQGLELYSSLHPRIEPECGIYRKNMGRNKFLADFIAEKTSVPRSTKQVASRLQQLRGSAQDGRGDFFTWILNID